MAEALKCPTCSAPLEYPTDGAHTVQCPFCKSTVLLSEFQSGEVAEGNSGGLGALLGKSMEMAQMARMLRAGNKIEAIKIYRQTFGVDLLTAKTAVENLASGRPAVISRSSATFPDGGGLNNSNAGAMAAMQIASDATKIVRTGVKAGLILTFVILAGTALFVAVIFRAVHQQIAPMKTALNQPKIVLPFNLSKAPTGPVFAHQVMEFGSEGIGAGQFKDARSVAVDGKGNIYVGDYSNRRIQVFDEKGQFTKAWLLAQDRQYLQDLSASMQGTLYATVSGHVYCYEGLTGQSFGEAATTHEDQSLSYNDAFATLSGDIYALADGGNIVILNSDGQIKSVINTVEKVGEELSFIKIVVNGTGDIYALSQSKGVFKFAPNGRYVNRFGGSDPDDPANMTTSFGLAVDGKGRVYVSGAGPAIRVFDGNGRYLDSFGGNDVVFGIMINDKNEIFACYRNAHVIRKFVVDKKG